ncbi:MAG: type II toxin-antitoxin system CcdA family antitoxin [Hyphomicrobiaceae bacterium]|nr:type II toxin-antitoxin system CcdA family antitoxin [Hyphomicrobiaceae bacterium]
MPATSAPAKIVPKQRADNRAKPRKSAVNVSINSELAAEAKAAGINLSATLEAALNAELKSVRTAKWQEDNRGAIESINTYVEKHGLPLAKYRTW